MDSAEALIALFLTEGTLRGRCPRESDNSGQPCEEGPNHVFLLARMSCTCLRRKRLRTMRLKDCRGLEMVLIATITNPGTIALFERDLKRPPQTWLYALGDFRCHRRNHGWSSMALPN